jgi:sialate O-acetylesterase
MKKTILLLVLLFSAVGADAKVKLPALVGDNMVLQQRSTVNLWGWAEPGKTVSVTTSWNGETYRARSLADSTWNLSVQTTGAGGPYEIRIDDGEAVVLKNVMLGEVWVCSGQSNMEMKLSGYIGQPVAGANEAVAHAGKYPDLRLFTVRKRGSTTPLDDVEGTWQISTPASAVDFSAVAFFFGRNLNEILDIPVGLICTAWGGSYIEAWMTDASREGIRISPGGIGATDLYNGMIHPLLNYGIAGWTWYQGESNRVYPLDYAAMMTRMVNLWREKWGRGELPFYYVQIAPHIYSDGADGVSTALVRDQQALAMQRIPNSGMAVTMDIGEPTNIHPTEKRLVGERLSYWALSETYGVEGLAFRAPEYQSMKINEDHSVTVQFGYPEEASRGRFAFDNGLMPWDVEFDGFELAGEDRVFHPAKAKVDRTGRRNSVTVRSAEVPQPVAVRYGWKNYTVGTLFSTMGLPVSSFRSDDWEVPADYSGK